MSNPEQFSNQEHKLSQADVLEQDPRENSVFLQKCQNIIEHQYNYFKNYGQAVFTNVDALTLAVKFLKDGTKIYEPNLDQYEFSKIPEPTPELKPEQEMQNRLHKIYELLLSANQIITEYKKTANLSGQSFWSDWQKTLSGPVAESDDFRNTDNLIVYQQQLRRLRQFLNQSSEFLTADQEKLKIKQKKQEQQLIEKFKLIHSGSQLLSEKEIIAIVQNICRQFQQVENQEFVFDRKQLAENTDYLFDAQANLNESEYCLNFDSSKFLTAETRSPAFFSFWLSGVSQALAKVDEQFLEQYISVLETAIKLKRADISKQIENNIWQMINLLIQKKEEKQDIDHRTIEIMSRTTKKRPKEKTLEELYKNDPISLKRIKSRGGLPDYLWKEQESRLWEQAKIDREPSREISEKIENPQIAFNPIEEERLRETVGRLESLDPELWNNKLFIANRADLSFGGFASFPAEKPKQIKIEQFLPSGKPSGQKAIAHLPCQAGEKVSLFVPDGYELKTIGWSETDPPRDIASVAVHLYAGENVYVFASPAPGFVHYTLEPQISPEKILPDETNKFLKTFTDNAFASAEIKDIIETAKSYGSVQEKIDYFEQEFSARRLDFVYGLGSDLLDEMYNHLGRERFYGLAENIGIGDCQIFSAMMAHIFRQAEIPARIVQGKSTYNSAFKVIGHAKVEYYDEQLQQWQEFEATSVADSTTRRIKQSNEFTETEQTKLAQLIKTAAVTENPDYFIDACRQIKNMVLENLHSLEQKTKRLDEFLDKYKVWSARGLAGANLEQTKNNIFMLFKLGKQYDSARIYLHDGLDSIAKVEAQKFERYENIRPYGICEDAILKFLDNQLQAGAMPVSDLVSITEQLIKETYDIDSPGSYSFRRERLLKDILKIFKNSQSDFVKLAAGEQIMKEIADNQNIIDSLDFEDQLNTISALLNYAVKQQKQEPEIFKIFLNLLSRRYTVSPLLVQEQEKERQQLDGFLADNVHLIKALALNPVAWQNEFKSSVFTTLDDDKTIVNQFLLEKPELSISEMEKEKLAYQLIKEQLPLNAQAGKIASVLYSLARIGLLAFKPNFVLSESREQTIKHLKIILENNIRQIVGSTFTSVFQPFIHSSSEIENFNPEHADLFLRNLLIDRWPNKDKKKSVDANDDFLIALDYFPELVLDNNLIVRWDQKFEREKQKNILAPVEYRLEFRQANCKILIGSPNSSNIIFDFFRVSSFLPEELSNRIMGRESFNLLKDLQWFLNKSLRNNERAYEKCLVNIITSDEKIQTALQNDFNQQKEQFSKVVLLYFLEHAIKSDVYQFWLAYFAGKQNQSAPPEVSPEIKDFSQKFPTELMDEFIKGELKKGWQDEKNKSLSERISILTAGKEKPDWQLPLAEFMNPYYSSLGVIDNLNRDLAQLLQQTDPEKSGPKFKAKLQILQRTFKNHLGPIGDFFNTDRELPQAGYEFSGHKEYQTGDDLRLIDAKVSARRDKPVIKRVYPEQEPKNNIFIINLDSLFAENKNGFTPHFRWGEILADLYDKLFSLLIYCSQENKKLEINLYFHQQEIFKDILPIMRKDSKGINRFDRSREIVLAIFAETNKFLPLLQEEYAIAQQEKHSLFLKRQMPEVLISGPANIIGLEKDLAGLLMLSRRKKTAASRLAGK